jgi:hypothetical protein
MKLGILTDDVAQKALRLVVQHPGVSKITVNEDHSFNIVAKDVPAIIHWMDHDFGLHLILGGLGYRLASLVNEDTTETMANTAEMAQIAKDITPGSQITKDINKEVTKDIKAKEDPNKKEAKTEVTNKLNQVLNALRKQSMHDPAIKEILDLAKAPEGMTHLSKGIAELLGTKKS